MSETSSVAVLFALLLVPTGIFLVVRAMVKSIRLRLCLALFIAVIAGAASYYIAVNHGWRPPLKGGTRLNVDPLTLGVAHFIMMLVVLVLLHFRLSRVRTKQ
jgi:hypothetical protein